MPSLLGGNYLVAFLIFISSAASAQKNYFDFGISKTLTSDDVGTPFVAYEPEPYYTTWSEANQSMVVT